MTKTYSQEFDLIVQSFCTVALLGAMGPTSTTDKSDKLRQSNFYKQLELHPIVRWAIDQTGIGNRGCAMMSLYALLVLPRELLRDRYALEYRDIERTLASLTQNTVNEGYPKLQYIRHIRNAVAHGNVEFVTNDVVRFHDKGSFKDASKNEIPCTFSTEIRLQNLGVFLNQLQTIHLKYINENR